MSRVCVEVRLAILEGANGVLWIAFSVSVSKRKGIFGEKSTCVFDTLLLQDDVEVRKIIIKPTDINSISIPCY